MMEYFGKIVSGFQPINDKVFKNGPSKICGRHPLKEFEGIWSVYGLEYSVPNIIAKKPILNLWEDPEHASGDGYAYCNSTNLTIKTI